MQLHFLPSLNSPNNPNIFIFFETRTQNKVAGKKSNNSDNSKGVYETIKKGYFEPNKRGTKIKKLWQKFHLLIFFNEIFTVYAATDGEYEKIKIKNFGWQGARMGAMTPWTSWWIIGTKVCDDVPKLYIFWKALIWVYQKKK